MRLIAIDPSINTLGIATFDNETLLKFATIKSNLGKDSTDEERIRWMLWLIDSWLDDPFWDVVVIERPQSWGAYKSMASEKSGALLQLHILVGALFLWAEKLNYMNKCTCHLVPVSTWKGQLPKDVTQAKMEAKYGVKVKYDHESDAIGLGDWWLKKQKETK